MLIDHICLGLYLGSLFCSIDLWVCFVPGPNCLDYYGFVVELEFEECNPPSFMLPCQDCLANRGLMWFHMNFRTICSSLLKNAVNILIEIELNL